MRDNLNLGRKLTWLPAAAVCLLGVVSVGGCSPSTRQNIATDAKQAAGLDTFSRKSLPDGSILITFTSQNWKEILTVNSGEVGLAATYTNIAVSKAAGALSCHEGVLRGDVTSNVHNTIHLKTLKDVSGINMADHAVNQPDDQICEGGLFNVQSKDDAHRVIQDVFGQKAI